jgi:hypothetical protein
MLPFFAGMAIAGGVLKAGSQIFGGITSSRADAAEGELLLQQAELYGLNAETAKGNVALLTTQAEIAGMGEDFAYAKARLAKGRISEKGRVTLAAQRTEFAARNVDPAFGSPLVAQAATAGRIAQDLDLTDATAAVEAADAKTRQAGILGQAAGAQGQVVSSIGQQLTASLKAGGLFSKSEDDLAAGFLGAATSLLSMGASLGGGGGGGGGINLSGFGFNPIGGASGS